jgi:hypothetical protein
MAIPRSRNAIALPQLPKSELLAAAQRYRTPSNFPNSELLAAAQRLRTPPTSQIANCLQQRFAIASTQLPKQRTACSSATLTHPYPYKTFDKN